MSYVDSTMHDAAILRRIQERFYRARCRQNPPPPNDTRPGDVIGHGAEGFDERRHDAAAGLYRSDAGEFADAVLADAERVLAKLRSTGEPFGEDQFMQALAEAGPC